MPKEEAVTVLVARGRLSKFSRSPPNSCD